MNRAIDLFVNPNMSAVLEDPVQAEMSRGAKEFYFKAGDEYFRDETIPGLLKRMDECGVVHSVLTIDAENARDWILDFSREHPERFSLCSQVNIDHGMDAVWAMEDLAARERVSMARVVPMLHEKPATHAHYYPVFAKCVEMDLPLSIFTGIPGPRADAACQDPIHLDRVCRDFPTLRLIMNHGADPWWGVAIRLMIKYPNLYLMTSAWMPKYLPAELIHFMNTRGQDKVMWASDHPVLEMRRCLEGVDDLDLRPGVREKYLIENARRAVLRERKPAREYHENPAWDGITERSSPEPT